VLLESLGLLALVLIADRGLRWLPLWIMTMLVLSITRDATAILGISAVALLISQRHDRSALRRNSWVVATGGLAALPALLLGGAPVRENLAYVLSGFEIPPDSSWSFVVHRYPGQLWDTFSDDLTSWPRGMGC